jgi:hypothetical protein
MAVTQMWAHGNAVEVESQDRNIIQSQQRLGPGAQIRVWGALHSTWMHIGVPTPAVLSGAKARLLRVFFLYEVVDPEPIPPFDPQTGLISTASGHFSEVRVFDGPILVETFPNLRLAGSHPTTLDTANTFVLPQPHPVTLGIGVSAKFDANGGGDVPLAVAVAITAAGADFEIG